MPTLSIVYLAIDNLSTLASTSVRQNSSPIYPLSVIHQTLSADASSPVPVFNSSHMRFHPSVSPHTVPQKSSSVYPHSIIHQILSPRASSPVDVFRPSPSSSYTSVSVHEISSSSEALYTRLPFNSSSDNKSTSQSILSPPTKPHSVRPFATTPSVTSLAVVESTPVRRSTASTELHQLTSKVEDRKARTESSSSPLQPDLLRTDESTAATAASTSYPIHLFNTTNTSIVIDLPLPTDTVLPSRLPTQTKTTIKGPAWLRLIWMLL